MNAGLQTMEVGARPLGDHVATSGDGAIERVEGAAAAARGRRVLHLSSARGGGGVPDLLRALLPLAAGAGVEVEWRVLFGDPEFQEVATGLHEGLQGAESAIEDGAFGRYLEACGAAAEAVADAGDYDAVVLHDPVALGLAGALGEARVLWRCHLDG